MWKRKKKNKCSNRNEHKLPPANANGINHSETQTPGPKLRKPYGRAGMSASACLCRRSKHKKNEYGVKMSIRANAGIRMKDGNRSKAGRKRDGIGEKSEIRANAGIRMKDENRSKTGRSGAGLGENRKQERMRV
jgi:hypothetical protein